MTQSDRYKQTNKNTFYQDFYELLSKGIPSGLVPKRFSLAEGMSLRSKSIWDQLYNNSDLDCGVVTIDVVPAMAKPPLHDDTVLHEKVVNQSTLNNTENHKTSFQIV